MDRRSLLDKSLMFFKGFFNAGVWPTLSAAQLAKVHAAGMQVYRTVASQRSDGTEKVDTDEQVLKTLSAVAPAVMIKMARASVFFRICSKQPVALLKLLEVASAYRRSWLADVADDLLWTASGSEKLSTWKAWELADFAAYACTGAPKLLRRFVEYCRSPAANLCQSWAKTASQRALGQVFVCHECGAQCAGKQVLAAHRWTKHGTMRPTREYVDGTHCVVCMLEFHTRDRLVQHLERSSPQCGAYTMNTLPKLPADEVFRLNRDAAIHIKQLKGAGRCRVHALLPCFRVPGPLDCSPTLQLEARRPRKPA